MYVTCAGALDAKIGHFINTTRVAMLPAVSAIGDAAPPLFVFKGRQLPYRQVIGNGRSSVETYADCLPPRALICMRERGGGVDTANFFQWAVQLAQHVQYLTSWGCKVLPIMDGYRSHMALPVLDMLHQNNLIIYTLLAHTSGKHSSWM